MFQERMFCDSAELGHKISVRLKTQGREHLFMLRENNFSYACIGKQTPGHIEKEIRSPLSSRCLVLVQ